MKFCSSCGSEVRVAIPEGDNHLRHICDGCETIHYLNPKMVVGTIPEWEDKILLCKRAIEPRIGLWTLPAGFMENRETTQQGALRETREEANARVELSGLYSLINLPHISQAYLLFRGQLLDLDFSPGEESLEVALFSEDEIPWDQLAFPVVIETLKLYFEDRKKGSFALRCATIERDHDSFVGYKTMLHK